ncbi:MAG: tRNA(Ile)(2)-agmatinylcytidine synthase [Nitrososphaeria archaeon]
MTQKLHIGIDDTDSIKGGCTTYIGALIVEEILKDNNIRFLDYPNLIRLNPNIPWKTRGNGAIALRMEVEDKNMIEGIKDRVIEKVVENSWLEDENTEPTIALLEGFVPMELKKFMFKSLRETVSIELAEKIARKYNIEIITLKGKRGIIGAISAIGGILPDEKYTFELLAYRKKENYGKPREIDKKSIYEMDKIISPYTFNNIDYKAKRILITPRGPDPVLFGIRGETPEILLQAFKKIIVYEPIERWIIYKTNQGTDLHYKKVKRIKEIKSYDSIRMICKIHSKIRVIKGGHLIFTITDGKDEIDCAIYEPAGKLRNIAKQLLPGDIIEIFGAAKETTKDKKTLNIEKLFIKNLIKYTIKEKPKCPICGSPMKNEGKNKGFECKKCKYKVKIGKIEKEIPREIINGIHIPSQKSHRHLLKPMIRYEIKIGEWPNIMTKKWYGTNI